MKSNRGSISTKEELLLERSKANSSRISLGNGLQVFFEKNDCIIFHYRLSQNGRNTTRKLGDLSSMSIDQARIEAKKFHEIVLQERALRSKSTFNKILAIAPEEKKETVTVRKTIGRKCFESMTDFAKFLDYLLSENGLDKSIKATICLLFLLPIHPRELFKAKWRNLENNDTLIIPIFTNKTVKKIPHPDYVSNVTVYLSPQAKQIISIMNYLNRRSGDEVSEFILSRELCKNEKFDEKFLFKWMSEKFVTYKINPVEFSSFFCAIALESDCFKEEVIYDFIKIASLPHQGRIESRNLASMKALLLWWGELMASSSTSLKIFTTKSLFEKRNRQ
jgi:hypothetical protein